MSADFYREASWGDNSLLLTLPFADIRFKGLSGRQRTTLGNAYSDYIANPGSVQKNGKKPSKCFAYRLKHTLDIPIDALSVNGHYTPQKEHKSDGINITGTNFKARIQSEHSPSPSLLGVAKESEFTQATVFENFLRVMAAHRALDQDGALLHSAGLVVDNEAYIFCGRSGAGKTTLARKAFECGAKILSDDINLLLPGPIPRYFAHAIPFTGEFGRTMPPNKGKTTFPVACVILLEQGERLKTTKMRNSLAVARLLTGCPFVNTDASESERLFDVLTELVKLTPVVNLESRIDDKVDSIIRSVRETMNND